MYIPVWMKEPAECFKNAASFIWNKLPNFMMSLPDSYFLPGSDVIHCQILILYPAVTSFIQFKKNSQNCAKVWFPEKVFCWLVLSHIGSSSILLLGVQPISAGTKVSCENSHISSNSKRSTDTFWKAKYAFQYKCDFYSCKIIAKKSLFYIHELKF